MEPLIGGWRSRWIRLSGGGQAGTLLFLLLLSIMCNVIIEGGGRNFNLKLTHSCLPLPPSPSPHIFGRRLPAHMGKETGQEWISLQAGREASPSPLALIFFSASSLLSSLLPHTHPCAPCLPTPRIEEEECLMPLSSPSLSQHTGTGTVVKHHEKLA